MVDTLMSTAPTAGGRSMPAQAKAPAIGAGPVPYRVGGARASQSGESDAERP